MPFDRGWPATARRRAHSIDGSSTQRDEWMGIKRDFDRDFKRDLDRDYGVE
jgi:hypothetical protein